MKYLLATITTIVICATVWFARLAWIEGNQTEGYNFFLYAPIAFALALVAIGLAIWTYYA